MGKFFAEIRAVWNRNMILRAAAASFGVWLFMKYVLKLIWPFALSVLFVHKIMPFVRKAGGSKKGLRSICAALPLMGISLLPWLLLLIFYWVFVSGIRIFTENFAHYRKQCMAFVHTCCCYLERPLGMDAVMLEERVMSAARNVGEEVSGNVIPKVIVISGNIFGIIAIVGIYWAVFSVFSIMLAKDYDEILPKIRTRGWFLYVKNLYDKTVRMIFSYMKMQLIIMSVIGGICSVVFWQVGFHDPFLWGYVVGFLDALPYIGTGTTLIPLSVFELVMGRVALAAIMITLYLVCYFLRQFMEPRLIGRQNGIHPLISMIAVFVGVRLFGLIGIVTGPLSYLLIRELIREKMPVKSA